MKFWVEKAYNFVPAIQIAVVSNHAAQICCFDLSGFKTKKNLKQNKTNSKSKSDTVQEFHSHLLKVEMNKGLQNLLYVKSYAAALQSSRSNKTHFNLPIF